MWLATPSLYPPLVFIVSFFISSVVFAILILFMLWNIPYSILRFHTVLFSVVLVIQTLNTMMSPHPGRPQATLLPLSLTLTCPAQTCLMMRVWQRSCHWKSPALLTGPNDDAFMRATTLTWSAPHLVVIHLVIGFLVLYLNC